MSWQPRVADWINYGKDREKSNQSKRQICLLGPFCKVGCLCKLTYNSRGNSKNSRDYIVFFKFLREKLSLFHTSICSKMYLYRLHVFNVIPLYLKVITSTVVVVRFWHQTYQFGTVLQIKFHPAPCWLV